MLGFTDRCAFFLIWGYFIIHLVILRPWGCKLPFLFQFFILLAWCPTEKKFENWLDGACHSEWCYHTHTVTKAITASTSQAFMTTRVSGKWIILCVFNCRRWHLVKRIRTELPHDIVQTRKHRTGATLQAMWLLHGNYQPLSLRNRPRYVVITWPAATRYSRIRWPCRSRSPGWSPRIPTGLSLDLLPQEPAHHIDDICR